MSHAEALRAHVGAFVDALAAAGVRHVVACPGSRSTPLAMVIAEHPELKLWMHLDERSAAYFGLGMAKASWEPIALLCTSGTAAANFFPAVVEARYARVPLVVLTADRPPELWEVGAPQTIDQLRLYGHHVKWFAQALLPEDSDDAVRHACVFATRAVAIAREAPAGPVHLNFPFREPLLPAAPSPPSPRSLRERGKLDAEEVHVYSGARQPDLALVDRLADELGAVERGLIVCGPQDDPLLPGAVARLAGALGWPVLADALSGARCGPHDRTMVVDAYDALLRDERFAGETVPKAVIRFGAMPTSKPVLQYLQRHPGCRQIVVDGGAGWSDPTLLASEMVYADGATLAAALAGAVVPRDGSAWAEEWHRANAAAREAIAGCLAESDEPFEGRVFAELAELLPDGATLFAGNSMPVRDLDTFFPSTAKPIRFLANRGANGIDGVVSSALGAAAVSDRPLVLVIGDLSLYHDMNGLLAAKLHGIDATIVLLNNDGGGIFSFLPQAAMPEARFEQLFGTPHGLDFRGGVEMYGGRYERVEEWGAFRASVAGAIGAPGLKVIEMRTERARNVELHRRIWPAVSAAIAGRVPSPAGRGQG